MLGVEETLEIWVMLNRRKLGGSHVELSTDHFCSVSRWAIKIPE